MRSKTTTAGAAILVLGIVVLAGPTFGFTTVISDRSVGISTADSSSALIALESEDLVVDDQNEPTNVLMLTNNADETLAFDIEVEVGEGLTTASEFSNTLSPGEGSTYAVTCEPGSGSGTTAVDVTVHSATGEHLSVERVTESYAIERDCPGSGPSDPEPSEADFEISQEHWLEDREYIFEITSGNVESAEWAFGDGTTGSGHYVQRTYDEPGTYEVTLTATVDGEEQTVTRTLTVSDGPEGGSDDPGDGGDEKPPANEVYEVRQESWFEDREYVFDASVGDAWGADWEFGDGTSASGHYVRHTYDGPGTYEVTVIATIDGYDYTYTETVVVEN